MPESMNPADIAASATRAGFFQDVVVASSRLLHNETASDRERRALRRGSELLRVAATSDAVLRQSTTQELSDASATLAVIRAAGSDASDARYFQQLSSAIQAALRGKRTDTVMVKINMVRELFLAVNEASLDASIRFEQERQSSPLPMPSPVNSSS
jgi:hypothetical protein